MAFILDPNQQQEEEQQAAQGTAPMGGQGAAITGTAAPSGPAGGGQKRSFANINQYLQQNQPQSAKLGEKVGGFVGQKVDAASQGLQQGQQQFGQQLQQNTRQFDNNLVQQAGQDPTKLQGGQFQQLKDKLSGTYSGPKQLGDEVFNKSKQAVDTANLSQSEAGRKQLLQQVQNPKRASAGISSLNNLLLQNNPQAQAKIQEQQARAQQLQQQTDAARTQAETQAKAAEAQNKQVGDQTRQAFLGEEGFVNQFKKSMGDKTASARAEAEKRSAAAQSLLKGGQVEMTPEAKAQALKDIGLSEEEYNKVSRAYNPNSAKSFDIAGQYGSDPKQLGNLLKQYTQATGDRSFSNEMLSGTLFKNSNVNKLNDFYNRQNKFGQYADQMAIGSKDLSDLSTIGGINPDNQALMQQVATKDDLAKLNAFNSLLGTQENFITDSQDLGSFNPDLVNFDRIRAGLV